MNNWKLTIAEWKNGVSYKHSVMDFEKLDKVWNYLGFKLKRERCGYSGMIGNKEYTVTRGC